METSKGKTAKLAVAPLSRGMWQFFVICALVVPIAYFTMGRLGVVGLVYLGGGLLGGLFLLYFALRFPISIFVIWLVSMSGMQTLGMLRMPGLPDFSYHRLLLIVILVMMMAGWVQGRQLFKKPHLPDVLVVLHTFYVLINQQTIGDPKNFNVWYLSSLAPLVAYLFARQFVDSEKQIKIVFWSFVLATTYFWYISIVEHFAMDAMVWPKQILADRGRWVGRSRGPFLQPALFGQILGMYLLAHLYMLSRKMDRKKIVFVAGNLLLGAVGLLYTFTRGGWLATSVGLIVLGVLRPVYRKVLISIAIGGILLGGVGIFQASNNDILKERVENTGTIENRLAVMASALNAIKQNPFVGVGYFRYTEEAYLYTTGVYVPFYGYVTKKMGSHVPLHDMYIGRAAEEGLLGMALVFGFSVVVARIYLKKWREHPNGFWYNRDFIAVSAAMSASYLCGGLFFDYRYFDLVNVLPYFLAGIVVGFPSEKVALGAKLSAHQHRHN